MKAIQSLEFTPENVYTLFGNEAAENEDPIRLKQYFFKNNTYNEVMAELPIRLLVGHKGIGKSALFQVARQEEDSIGTLTVAIQPDDIAELSLTEEDHLKMIRNCGIKGTTPFN